LYSTYQVTIGNFLVYKSQQDAHVTEFIFCLRNALHVSGFIITHLQEHKTTVTTASGNRYTVLLSAAIVKELELILADNSTVQWSPDAVVKVLCS
jgi:hypothetical protein